MLPINILTATIEIITPSIGNTYLSSILIENAKYVR